MYCVGFSSSSSVAVAVRRIDLGLVPGQYAGERGGLVNCLINCCIIIIIIIISRHNL